VQGTRQQFRESLRELERQTLGAIDMVIEQLDRSLEAVRRQDVDLADAVVADDDRIDGRYLEVHQGILSMLATQSPVATDLRIVAALLHIIRCVERMGDQCVNIAKLVMLSGPRPPKDTEIIKLIETMGELTRSQARQAKEAFATRHVALAGELVGKDMTLFRLDRLIFNRAVEIGENVEVREWAMFMILVSRALERIGENSFEIAEQTAFVVSGLFREFPDP
jgi:phosphate transport system protein